MSGWNPDEIDVVVLPIAYPFETEEFHGGTGTDLVQTLITHLHEVTAFVAFEPLGLGFGGLPVVLLDGADGIVMHESAHGEFAGDVVEGESLLFVAESKPVTARAFFFEVAGSVFEE